MWAISEGAVACRGRGQRPKHNLFDPGISSSVFAYGILDDGRANLQTSDKGKYDRLKALNYNYDRQHGNHYIRITKTGKYKRRGNNQSHR